VLCPNTRSLLEGTELQQPTALDLTHWPHCRAAMIRCAACNTTQLGKLYHTMCLKPLNSRLSKAFERQPSHALQTPQELDSHGAVDGISMQHKLHITAALTTIILHTTCVRRNLACSVAQQVPHISRHACQWPHVQSQMLCIVEFERPYFPAILLQTGLWALRCCSWHSLLQ
jgi:hypothetical protein